MVMILDAFISSCVKALATMAITQVAEVLGVHDEIQLLQRRLERMLKVVADAERRRFQVVGIDCWVKQLKGVMYDAENIIEECKLEGEKLTTASNSTSLSSPSISGAWRWSSCSPILCFHTCAFRQSIAVRIKTLNDQLDRIIQDIPALSLIPTSLDHSRKGNCTSRTTHMVEPDLVGDTIEDDTNYLVDFLLSRAHQLQQQEVSVLAIVGMGGIGKTTLAQKIYNNEKLRAGFALPPIWVCVSKDFSQTSLLRTIISRTGGDPGTHEEKEDLEPMLLGIFKDKKFFLVLDDVWDAEGVWEKLLRKPLTSCWPGGVILVTTRQQSVAKDMGSLLIHRVKKLSNEDGWSLLCKMVFTDNGDGEYMRKSLTDTGMKIVRKCDGLPLAVRAIAGVLRRKDKRLSVWEKVLQNPAWSFLELPDGLRGALYLSYEDLPPHLKQCFIYLGLFPADTEYWQFVCARFWIAEGFVESKDNSTVEELADEYWEELLERNILQRHNDYFYTGVARVHDLLHSLARHLAEDECSIGACKPPASSSLSTKGNIVLLRDITAKSISYAIHGHTSLRTLHLQGIENFTNKDVKKLRYVRVLEIPELQCERLPSSIGNFICLRFLNLRGSAIRELPTSIGMLQNFQILILKGCNNLRELPSSITNLRSLRDLELNCQSLLGIPLGMERLQQLITFHGWSLSDEVIDDHRKKINQQSKYCTFEVLKTLSQLRNFSLWNLGAASVSDAREADLKSKAHLLTIWLRCNKCPQPVHYDDQAVKRIELVFKELSPPPSVEWLVIDDYYGREFPSWMTMPSSAIFPNLRWLRLVRCINCQQLPSLGSLPQLESLKIAGACSIMNIGPEFFLTNSTSINVEGANVTNSSFPKLARLIFEDMDSWEEWSWLSEEEDRKIEVLPCLERLELLNCPKLRSFPEGLFYRATSLASIFIHDAHSLMEVKNLDYVKDLTLQRNGNLEKVSNLPGVKNLTVVDCKSLKHVEKVDALQHLVLKDKEIDSVPDWLFGPGGQDLQFKTIQKMHIEGNSKLLMRCLENGSHWCNIKHVPQFSAFTTGKSMYISWTKSTSTFYTNLSDDRVASNRNCSSNHI